MEQILFLILAIAVIVGIYFLTRFLPSQAEYRGRRGEQCIFSILKQLPDEYYTGNDIVIQRNGYSVQIDHVVISPYGIFVIETKNYTGWIYGNDDSDQWTKNMYGHKYHFGNPLKQNYSHVKALADLFCMSVNSFILSRLLELSEMQIHNANLEIKNRHVYEEVLFNGSPSLVYQVGEYEDPCEW